MANTVWIISYQLVAGASVPEYLRASEGVHREVLSQQKGFLSWKVLKNGDTWVDLVVWETPEDAKNAETAGQTNPIAQKYYSFIDFPSLQHQNYTVEKDHP